MGEETQGPGAIAVEVGQHLHTEIERDDPVGHVRGRQDGAERGPADTRGHGVLGEGEPRPEAGRDLGSESRRGRRPGDHLGEDGDVAGVEVLPEDGHGHVDQL
jgi:hypothetical protein